MKKLKNPVAKFNNEFNKPKTFRDRKARAKQSGEYGDKPKHKPYKRVPYDYGWEEDKDAD